MVCRACGRVIANENANFCEYCGTATNASREGGMNYGSYGGEGAGDASHYEASGQAGNGYASGQGHGNNSSYGRAGYGNASGYGQNTVGDPGLAGILNGTAGVAEAENSMGFLHWIVILLLPFIPMIGMFAYLAVLLIWAFGRTASKTRKSWARATLVITVISFFMVMYMFQTLLGSEGMAEIMNSVMGTGGIS